MRFDGLQSIMAAKVEEAKQKSERDRKKYSGHQYADERRLDDYDNSPPPANASKPASASKLRSPAPQSRRSPYSRFYSFIGSCYRLSHL